MDKIVIDGKQIFAVVLIVVLLLNMTLFALGKVKIWTFAIVIGLAYLYTRYTYPKNK